MMQCTKFGMENKSICDGILSQYEFLVAARALCNKWKSVNTTLSNWTWTPIKRTSWSASCDEGYLSLENVYYIKSSMDHLSSQDLDEAEDEVDDATMVQPHCNSVHVYEFHITYSFSYRAPILYFHGSHCDGRPLDFDEIQKDLPEYSLKFLRESKWTFITMEEHPYLHQPWYMLHPCGTADLMKLLLGGGAQATADAFCYLASWLSIAGQAVGLRIPIGLSSSS
ncbi:hypothetical protein HPP92_001291 [Vanilla planifolia]|uniref:Ubiquitin-like-conjugating enzyme ATG10 n=1 Tax=Vanilla planifolia TaxID=51239 RepID=A0A835VGX4_VANPL|nr:hypothetical protein HPP92_001291 [Vanilla planifolia]